MADDLLAQARTMSASKRCVVVTDSSADPPEGWLVKTGPAGGARGGGRGGDA